MRTVWNLTVLTWAVSGAGSSRKKTKVGTDIDLTDMYHPWDEDVDESPSSAQHQVGEYITTSVKEGDSLNTAIELLESFSTSKHLGMTLGNPKGKIIEDAISISLNRNNWNNLVFIELGSHIGDGTLRIIRQLSAGLENGGTRKCIVFSLEANNEWLGIGTNIVRHVLQMTGNSSKCRYVPMTLTNDITHTMTHIKHVLKAELKNESVSGIFLDHNHAKFNRDIQIMHDQGLLAEGTLILADNALRHKKVMKGFIDEMRTSGKFFQLAPVTDPYPDEVLVVEWNKPKVQKSENHDRSEL